MAKICLCMIVKNESKIISRLFETAKNIFDTYCICDTGSTDNTSDIIKTWMRENNKNGHVIYEPFKNFGYNRTHCIKEAQRLIRGGELDGDYFLFLDADMKLVVTEKFNKDIFSKNGYSIIQKSPTLSYYNLRFVRTSSAVTCRGVTHEYYDVPEGDLEKIDETVMFIDDVGDGGSKTDKAPRDLRLLTEGIEDSSTPTDLKGRYYFYRANTYFDTNQNDLAIEDYKKRIEIGGWVEEVWYSKYRIGLALERLGRINDCTIAHLAAYQHHPKRAEPLYELTRIHRVTGKNHLAYAFYKLAKDIPYPENDVLFINRNVYSYLLDYELSVIGYYVGAKNIDKLIIRLLNKEEANLDFGHMMSNYKFYSKNLTAALTRDFTDIKFPEFSSSTPCIFKIKDGYQMFIRHHNYTINPDGSYSSGDKITSKYSVKNLTKDLVETSSFLIKEPDSTSLKYQGIEDVKLFTLDDSKIYFMGTAQNPETENLSIAFGKWVEKDKQLRYTFVKSPENRACEKNWAFFSTDGKNLEIVYEWEGFKTYTVKEEGKEFLLTNHDKRKTPKFFKNLRGSTNGYRDGRCIWFLCHVVNFEPHRSYYHVFVIYDHVSKKFIWTIPFKFEGKNVEYALGLVVENTQVLVSYSTSDNTSKLAIIDKREICKMFMD